MKTSPLIKSLKESWWRYRKNRAAIFGLILFTFITLLALLADWIAPYDPLKTGLTDSLIPPSSGFIMGTDQIGRDIFSGVIYGSRIALLVGLTSTLIAVIIALVVGVTSGYLGGVIDDILMRIVEILLSIPAFIFAIVIVALYGITLTNVILVIGMLSWPTLARIVRAEVLSLKEREFVLAAKSLGAGGLDLMFSEILPNALPPLIPAAALQVANAILIEAGLSFLGLSDPNVMSWGKMLWIAQQAFYAGAWWPILFPGIFILLTVLSVNLIGDGLNDALNPRGR